MECYEPVKEVNSSYGQKLFGDKLLTSIEYLC